MVKTRFGRTLKGQNWEVFVASETAYTAQTTYSAFAANLASLADGELGVFNDDATFSLRTTALTTGSRFFIAQKVSGQKGDFSIKKSIVYTYGSGPNGAGSNVYGYVYSAPVKPIAYIGFNGTSGSLNAAAIAIGQDYQITLLDTTPPVANPMNALQAGRTVAATTETVASILGDPQTGIVAQINGNQTTKSFFAGIQLQPQIYVADLITDGTYTAVTTTASHGFTAGSRNVVTGGVNNVVVGDRIRVGANAGTTGTYTVTAVGTGAFTGATANDYTIDRPFAGTTGTITVFRNTVAPTQYGVKITTVDYFSTFAIALGSTGFANATITYSTRWNLGIGTPEETAEFEYEGNTFHGVGSIYNNAFPVDWGIPVTYTKSNRAYATIDIVGINAERSVAAPNDTWSSRTYLAIKAPYGSTTFTLGGVLQTNGFSAIVTPQVGLSAAAASPVVTLATIFPNI